MARHDVDIEIQDRLQGIVNGDGPKCPCCGHEHTEAEDWQGHVSYWGSEEGARLFKCHSCDHEFAVFEHVVRTWESFPLVQKAAQ